MSTYVRIGKGVIIGPHATVDVKYRPVHPGICVEIGDESQLFGSLVVQRHGAHIRIGSRTQIGASTLMAIESITVGDDGSVDSLMVQIGADTSEVVDRLFVVLQKHGWEIADC